MNQVAAIKPAEQQPARRASLLEVMAAKYHMDPQTFANTVRKTAMPGNATNEEFAAFMMVAKEYNLNPILKEIHAFPKKGGGIQPIVSIDGWVSLVNQHPQADGYTFKWHNDEKGEPISCECTMHRKDRTHPVVVEEFLSECYRATEPWKMKHRMLRHKAFMQAARYCFGFSGIIDQDEAERGEAMRDITPPPRPQMSDFTSPAKASDPAPAETKSDPATGEILDGDGEGPEFGAFEAMELGRERRRKNLPRTAPPECNVEGLVTAYVEGWDEVDSELQAAAKGGAK